MGKLFEELKLAPPKALQAAAPPRPAPAKASKPAPARGPTAMPAPVLAAEGGDDLALPSDLPPVAVTGMKDEEIAAAIMDKQLAILEGWETALQVFDKTMTSSADAEAKPDFQGAIVKHFGEKLMGALVSHAPGASELDAMVKSLEGEIARASAAGGSAKLRDFVVGHAQQIGKLQQATLSKRQAFLSAVRARREKVESRGSTQADADAYGMMRMALVDTHAAVERTLAGATPENLFKVLSEQWMRSATTTGGLGYKFPAWVIIRLNPDYSVKEAHIQGSGGQKIAEQLIKDSPNGMVDVFRLKAPRRILLLAKNGWPSATLSLDANNKDVSTGSFAEGNTDALKRWVMGKGSLLTNKITGD